MDKIHRSSRNRYFIINSIVIVSIIAIIALYINLLSLNILMVSIFIALLIAFIVFIYKNKKYISSLENLIDKDRLTGLYNYDYFTEKLEEALKDSNLKNKPLSVMFIDINCLKLYNDINGSLSGDLIIKELGKILSSIKRKNYILARYSEEQFVIILKDTTKEEGTMISNNIKHMFNEKNFSYKIFGAEKNITLSIGISEFPKEAKDYLEIIKSCDDSLNKDRILNKAVNEDYTSALYNIKYELNQEDKELMGAIKTLIGVINAKDGSTYDHVERVVQYAKLMADELMLNKEERRKLIYGAYIHDIGKIIVNKEILIKRMPLSNEEWQEVKGHSKYGWKMINKINCLKDMSDMVLYHHERYDGKGYPEGLKGEKIPYLARILTVVDSFDAMTSARPYNKKKSYKEGIEELKRCSGTQFDPEIVEKFSNSITKNFLSYE